MTTVSHALIAAAVGTAAKAPKRLVVAAALGGGVPDLPLALLTGWTMLRTPSLEAAHDHMHWAFEHDRLWIVAHNVPHSLVVLGVVALLGGGLWSRGRAGGVHRLTRRGAWLLWFSLGATLHTLVDIATHVDDGPRFLFPLSSLVQLTGPVSYWDPAHGGAVFRWLEVALGVLLAAYLGWTWWRCRVPGRGWHCRDRLVA